MAYQRANDSYRLKKRQRLHRWLLFILIITIVFLIGIVYLLFFMGLFNVRDISVNSRNSESVVREYIETFLQKKIFIFINKKQNIFFINTDVLAMEIKKALPILKEITIKKEKNHKLAVAVIERIPNGIWCIIKDQLCFYYDANNIAYAKTAQTQGLIILKINDERENSTIELGKEIVGQELLGAIDTVKKLLNDSNITITSFVIPKNSFDEFHVITDAGWQVYFNSSSDINKQIVALNQLLKTRINQQEREQLRYVDLRIKDRIYYR